MSRLARYLEAGLRVLLVGGPGCAKTARFYSAWKEMGNSAENIFVARLSLMERVDIMGGFVPDVSSGVTRTLPLEWLHGLLKSRQPRLLLLDDLGQGPMDVQAGAMKLFDKEFLPGNVFIGAATNRPGDKAGVNALCEPLRSRFDCAFRIAAPDTKEEEASSGMVLQPWHGMKNGVPYGECLDWCDWAIESGAPPIYPAWHRATSGRTLYSWKPHADPSVRMADFRTWESSFKAWNAGFSDLDTQSSIIGKVAAAEFTTFANLIHKVPTPDDVRSDPTGADVPTDTQAVYLVCSMLSDAATEADAEPFVKYMERLSRVFGAFLGRDLYRKLGPKLSGSKAWSRWFTANQALFIS